jgi:hypothetical protein
MQGKAEFVAGPLGVLQEFYRDKLTALQAHEAASRLIPEYDVNNTYQYVINREDTQLSWIADAIAELGGTVPESAPEPTRQTAGTGRSQSRSVIEEDAHEAQAFVDRWRTRVDSLTHAGHRGMLRVILGETLEQKRFFEQALAGRTDLLGRRSEQVGPRVGKVMSTRWVE